MTVVLVVLEGATREWLDDEGCVGHALDAAIDSGRFTLFQKVVQRFEPQGVTAVAVVGESHLAVHTWPEEGRLFLDIATCGDPSLADPAVAAFVASVPNARVAKREARVLDT